MKSRRLRAVARLQELLASPAPQYLVAAGGVVSVTLVRAPLEPWLQGNAPFAFYFPLLAAIAWAFELGPTLAALVLSTLLAWRFFIPPDRVALISIGLFLVSVSGLIVLARLAAATRRAVVRALEDTERAHVERARLAAIVSSSDDAIISKDLNGIIASWNAGAERVFGYRAEEMVGESILRLIPEERRFEEDHILLRLRRGERIEHFETVRLAKDGRALHISLSISPIHNADGEVVGASKIARDVTQTKRAEQEIAHQRELLRVTLSSIGDGVATTNASGAITYMNPMAERLSGVSLQEALGKPLGSVFRTVYEATRQPVDDLYAKLLLLCAAEASQVMTNIVIAQDGREVPTEQRARPIVDGDGKHGGLVVCFRDVSERREAEAALAEQREWLETTLVSIGDAVIATDIHGRVSFMNPVAEHLTGWKTDEARGQESQDVFRIVNEYSRGPVESPVARVLREGAVIGLANHTVLLARDGREIPIDDSAAPIRNLDGRITGVVVVFHDVAERRQIELERQRAERERELLLQSERAARSEAERANRLKDQFLATVSHELRTPLSAILGWTDMLQRNSEDKTAMSRGLQVIERNARIQAQLVADLLDVSRIVSGKLKLELQLVGLQGVIEQALETVRTAADAKHIVVERFLDATIQPMLGDPDRLQQVVWNLLSNAVKFTPERGVVSVRLERVGQHAVITVSDTGAGIPADFLPHLFDRFRQADGSTSRRHGGLGLGLTIVKQLVELHGGTVSAQSGGVGAGARFEVTLPLDAAEALEDVRSVEHRSSAPPAIAAERLRGLRILLVEDDADGREMLERLLAEAGCSVTAAASAREALEQLEQEAPDLILSDIGLPDQDGYSLLEEIRRKSSPGIAHVPAIALTAFARSEDRARAMRAGFQAHLTKPVDPAELLATVTSFAGLVSAWPKRRS